ncbi:MAG: hemin uptake protein HemP [Pseudaminobacter sp.]|nr:hemin uptake protein HemP [Pseudaminobacter sp.]
MPTYRPAAPQPQERSAQPPLDERRFSSAELFGGATEIVITHKGAVYRMKITRQGKLILNK